jgi:phage shock protein PspC (stress-responsive transcriptional regulator)
MTDTSTTATDASTTAPRRSGFLGDVRGWFREEGLIRSREGRWLGGVCLGVANRYGVDPLLVRAAALLTLFLPGPQVVAYAALWVLMPQAAPRSLQAPPLEGTGA